MADLHPGDEVHAHVEHEEGVQEAVEVVPAKVLNTIRYEMTKMKTIIESKMSIFRPSSGGGCGRAASWSFLTRLPDERQGRSAGILPAEYPTGVGPAVGKALHGRAVDEAEADGNFAHRDFEEGALPLLHATASPPSG